MIRWIRIGHVWIYRDAHGGLAVERMTGDNADKVPHNLRVKIRRDAVRKWQKVRDTIWMRSAWAVRQTETDTVDSYTRRRRHYLEVRYAVVAGDERARGRYVPTLDDLRSAVGETLTAPAAARAGATT